MMAQFLPISFINILTKLLQFEFLPLMSLSCIGAIQMVVCWMHSYTLLFSLYNDGNKKNNDQLNTKNGLISSDKKNL